MDISYNWLKEYVNFDLDPSQVETILTSIGLEIEGSETREEIPGGLAGVVVAEVLTCIPHPDSDHLHITTVNAGEGEPLQVVCGAPNVAAGKKVMLATLGTTLTFSDGTELKMKKSKIRGVESFGMLCAEDELGIGESHDGIMILDEGAVPGTPAKEYLHLKEDTVFTIGLTANRIDAASHIGVARDLSAYLKYNGLGGEMKYPSVDSFDSLYTCDRNESCCADKSAIEVCVKAANAAPRYSGLTIRGVKVGQSPDWLKARLLSVGQRPINSVVDITNFILQEMGQPMHAFDADKIKGGKVVVDFCADGTKFTTLDGVERSLSSADLMICNESEPMCIAGVFGGQESGVTTDTVNIFLESAYFNPVYVRKTSKRHTLKTDAAFHYERGCDPLVTVYALKRAALLVKEICGGVICGDIVDVISNREAVTPKRVEVNYARMESVIGKEIGADTIKGIMQSLEMKFVEESAEGALVEIPPYRVDVYRECDIIEDVLRIYGYNNIELPQNVKASINTGMKPDPEKVTRTASNFLSAAGFNEIMNNSLTKSDYYSKLKTLPVENCVMILNPLSNDLNAMRQTLLFNALEVVAYNVNRQISDLKLYEFGHVYFHDASKVVESDKEALKPYSEEQHLSIVISGNGTAGWRNRTSGGNFFTLKGYVDMLFARFGVSASNMEMVPAPVEIYSEGMTYMLNGKEVASLGEVAPARLKQAGLKQKVYFAEIKWDVLFKQIKKVKVLFKELPKYPEVKRDLALLVGKEVKYSDLYRSAFGCEKKLLRSVSLFDVYTGDKIPSDKKQYALSFVLRDDEKTLNDNVVESVMNKILKAFEFKFGAQLR